MHRDVLLTTESQFWFEFELEIEFCTRIHILVLKERKAIKY